MRIRVVTKWISAAALLLSLATVPAFAQKPSDKGLKDEAVGMHTGLGVAGHVATFTMNPSKVSCGVGTLDGTGSTSPFEMLMFSLTEDSYTVDRTSLRLRSTGTMRSITRVAGVNVEDTDGVGLNPPPTNFIAIADDNQDKLTPSLDHVQLHFKTPFWNTGNALCTPSNQIEGGCVFEGDLFLGRVVVSPK